MLERMEKQRILVSVGILSFNQEQYISQCLDSILSQETDFPFEIIIGDDFSTDLTRAILTEYQKRYPNRIKLLLNNTNVGIAKNYQTVLSHCSGKYIALCEGDDYWTDSNKLQLQTNFLEAHEDCGFVGAYNLILTSDGHFHEDRYDYMHPLRVENNWEYYGNVFEFAKHGPVTRTASICFRKSIIDPYIDIVGTGNDLVLQTILARFASFAKYSKAVCVYREGGISTNRKHIQKKLQYNDWYVQNRLLQKKIFPVECDWDESELIDRGTYILLKDSIISNRPCKALSYKRTLLSDLYKKKKLSKYLMGPISCLLLSFYLRCKKDASVW